jgi:hypothetical protein
MKIKDFFDTFDVNPISADPMHGPITDDLIEYIQQRNEQKRKRSIELLGSRWLLHPANKQQKVAA